MAGYESTKRTVVVRTEQLVEVRTDLEWWANRYPIFNRARLPALALTLAAHLTDRPRANRSLMGLLSLWIAAFDELVDQDWLTSSALHELADRCKAAVGGVARDTYYSSHSSCSRLRIALSSGEQLLCALDELRLRLMALEPEITLAGYWQDTFGRMIDGIIVQRELGASLYAGISDQPASEPPILLPVDVPPYDVLMRTLQHSIGVPHYLATCFLTYRDPELADRLPSLLPAVEACAKAVRLANDLRSWRRDIRERNVNMLVAATAAISRSEPGLSASECQERALHQLSKRLAIHVAEVHSLLNASHRPDGAAERGLVRLVDVVTGVYASHDYHTWQPN